jgi:hypothetical protein
MQKSIPSPLSKDFVPLHDGNAEGISPGRLWSLWDMLKINARGFYRTLLNVHAAQLLVEERKKDTDAYLAPIADQKLLDDLLRRAKLFQGHALNLGAPVTASLAEHHIWTIGSNTKPSQKELVEAYNNLIITLEHELSTIFLFAIEAEKKRYFEPKEPLFGPPFAAKFQTMGMFELDEAAKCLALGRPTAAVFHLMRLMEIGIRSVSRCLRIPDPLKPADRNWGNILREIKADIDAHSGNKPSKAWALPEDREFFESAYASLDAVRVAWRNTTMHVENKYTDDEAEHIFLATKGFMKKLASRMDEDGEPKA